MADKEDKFEIEMQDDPHPEENAASGPIRSVEGYIIIATNIHEEATEDDVTDFFSDFGKVKNVHLNLDRRTGFVKGYVLVEYAELSEATKAVEESNGKQLLGLELQCDFAFKQPAGGSNGNARRRSRSASPRR